VVTVADARSLTRMDAFHVGRAKELLADIRALDFSDALVVYALLGRAQVVLAGLVETVEGGEPE
jgi:hypothetical protein